MITLDVTRKSEAVNACWNAYRERVPEYESDYYNAVTDWNPIAVCDDDKVIGALLVKNGVIHLGIVPEYRGKWASRRIIKEMLAYGTATTLTDDEPDEFVKRIGFVKTGDRYEFHR